MVAAVAKRQIRCLGPGRNGGVCNQWLVSADDELINSEYAAHVQFRCRKCGTVYTLADPRFKVLT